MLIAFLAQEKDSKAVAEPLHLALFGKPQRDARFFGWASPLLRSPSLSLPFKTVAPVFVDAVASVDPVRWVLMRDTLLYYHS